MLHPLIFIDKSSLSKEVSDVIEYRFHIVYCAVVLFPYNGILSVNGEKDQGY